MQDLTLQKPKSIHYGLINILTKPDQYKRILCELPTCYTQTLQGLYDTIKEITAKPLLSAENLEEKIKKLRDSFSLLRLSLNTYIGHMWQEYPKETERLFKEGAKEVEATIEKQRGLLLGENVETFLGVFRLYTSLGEDFLRLWKQLDITEFPIILYEVAVDLDLCVLSILSSLLEEPVAIKKRELQNLQKLIFWAKEHSLKYATGLSQFLRKQLLVPHNTKLAEKFYTKKFSEFIGSGPKGVYEALLEERRWERALKNG